MIDGERPICCIVGNQYGSTLYLGKTLHDPEYNAFSAGIALQHIVTQDLIEKTDATSIYLGYGHLKVESRTTNVVHEFASYWLLPSLQRNRSVGACYRVFKRSVAAIKRLGTARSA